MGWVGEELKVNLMSANQRVLFTDTVVPGGLPVRDCYWQIQCCQKCYQPDSVIGRYSDTTIVTSQRVLLADTVLPGVLPPIECYWQIQYYQECYPIEKFHRIHYFQHITFNPPPSPTVSSLF